MIITYFISSDEISPRTTMWWISEARVENGFLTFTKVVSRPFFSEQEAFSELDALNRMREVEQAMPLMARLARLVRLR